MRRAHGGHLQGVDVVQGGRVGKEAMRYRLTDPADAEIVPTTLSRPLKLLPPSNSTHEHIAFVLPGRMWRVMWPPPSTSIARDPHRDVDAADSRGWSNPGQHALAGVLMEDAEHSCLGHI